MLKEIFFIISISAIPFILFFISIYGSYKKVPVYESFIRGSKQGFGVGVRIIPYLIAMLVAVGMFRASGAIELISEYLSPFLSFIGMPAELIPLAIVRSLSGSGALGVLGEIAANNGGEAYVTKLAALMTGSSETTFYVLALYFGSVKITKTKHALSAGLFADAVGIIAAFVITFLFFG